MTAGRSLGFLRAAEQELVAAAQWYRRISETPDHHPRYMRSTRRYLLRGFPFFVVFRATETEVVIIAVAHTSRRPGYWSCPGLADTFITRLRSGKRRCRLGAQRRRFTWEFEVEVVRMTQASGRSVADVARELGIRPDLLHEWRRAV